MRAAVPQSAVVTVAPGTAGARAHAAVAHRRARESPPSGAAGGRAGTRGAEGLVA